MVKSRGKVRRSCKPKSVYPMSLELEEWEITGWSPDPEAKLPMEQLHIILHVEGLEEYAFVLRFKSPDSLGFLIEELADYRTQIWPDAEPVSASE